MLERIIEILVAIALGLGSAASGGLAEAADRVGGVDAGVDPAAQPAVVVDDPAAEGAEIAFARFEAIQARIAEALAAAAEQADDAAADGLATATEAAGAGLQEAFDGIGGAGGGTPELPETPEIPDAPTELPSVVPTIPSPPAGRP